MADGSEKPIEQVRPGDKVLSADPQTKRQSQQPVARTFVHPADTLVRVTTEDGRSVECTPTHPFWVEGKGFVAAKRLARSDLLVDADGEESRVASVTARTGRFTVYNFEVANTHTYYAGAGRWWVHNVCPKEPLDPFPYDPHPSAQPLTPEAEPGNYVYVRDVEGQVHVAPDGPHMHPRVLGGGQSVTGAGTLKIGPGGVVTEVDNISGTFQFGEDSLPGVVESIQNQGLTVRPGAVKVFRW